MYFEKEKTCPLCRKTNVEAVSFLYQSLKSDEAGKKIFSQGPIATELSKLSPRQKEKLLHRLTPPPEPKTSLPAGPIALMAFLVSWLATGSLITARIGQKAYFWLSVVIICAVTIPFYWILKLVIENFRREIFRYKKLKAVWKKQYFCHHCQRVFIPKE